MFASLSLKPRDRQQLLSRVATQATDAAALALYVGKGPEHAIELLETGRGLIAGTLQDFRVDITLLERSNPDLARRFAQLRDTLDVPATVPAVETSLPIEVDDLPFAFSPFEADRRHEASNELSSILDEIRQIQGFERFLLAGTEAQMKAAAAHGPIVLINAGSYRCDALIIEHTNIQALKLSNLKLEDIKSHHIHIDSPSTALVGMTIIEIGVIFDFVCAWCYIGKRKLDRAISLYQKTYPGGKKDTFSITWKPYYMHYNPHPQSVDKSEVAKVRLSDMSPERQAALTRRMEQIGRSVGVIFKWGGKIGPDTRDTHRLMRLSRSEDASVQSALIDGLFAAYHELEQDISDIRILQNVATGAGMSGVDVEKFLQCTTGLDEVKEEEIKTRELAAGSGVPVFIIQGVHRSDGAQDPSDFYEAFVKVKEADTTHNI
ncbi:hypothetical protein COL940_007945 [Colletotrichum noveboracense]|nr:hypothetical protein COL940_007945 [Colletotrichum noveboracense]KAJ0284738.1 hypothetical protein CBS470a_006722 [Colletotrichum nupharicola]